MTTATVHQGHGHAVLRGELRPRSVDMIYADPPFFTQTDWVGEAGSFSDRWKWDAAAEALWQRITIGLPDDAAMLEVIASNRKPLLAYLLAMHQLVTAARSRLKPTGTFWLHCDDTASAYLRILCDLAFGPGRYWGTILWRRASGQSTQKNALARVLDYIHVYVRTGAALQRLAHRQDALVSQQDWCEIDGVRGHVLAGFLDERLTSGATERVGYPTQKPAALLRTLIAAGSLPGDLVVDPCCGSGTTLVAARELGRDAIGIDISPDAVALARRRTGHVTFQMDLFGEMAL